MCFLFVFVQKSVENSTRHVALGWRFEVFRYFYVRGDNSRIVRRRDNHCVTQVFGMYFRADAGKVHRRYLHVAFPRRFRFVPTSAAAFSPRAALYGRRIGPDAHRPRRNDERLEENAHVLPDRFRPRVALTCVFQRPAGDGVLHVRIHV